MVAWNPGQDYIWIRNMIGILWGYDISCEKKVALKINDVVCLFALCFVEKVPF